MQRTLRRHPARQLLAILAGILFACSCANRYEEPELLPLLSGLVQARTPTLLVLGDSLTEYSNGFGLSELLAGQYATYWKGAPNRDIPYWTMRISEALSLPSGEIVSVIVFPMGTNDAYLYDSSAFRANVRAFHTELRKYANATIFYCRVPRTKDLALQGRILANNESLTGLVPSLSHAGLIDLDTAFEERLLATPLYPASDSIHPNESGNRLIGETIRTAVLTSASTNPFP